MLSDIIRANLSDDQSGSIRRCSVCGEPLEKRIVWAGREMTVACRCDCQMKQEEARRQREEEEERRRRIARVRTLSMMPGKYEKATFEASVKTKDNAKAFSIAQKYAESFRSMERENQGLLIYGPVGTGKSYVAACIANHLMDLEVPVIMTSVVRILDSQWEDREAAIKEAIRSARLLIIDDLGAERETDFAMERVYSLIDDRVRSCAPMIVTTNIPVKEMLHTQDIRKKRIFDRILEVCFPVEMVGTSMRLQFAAKRQNEMRRFLEGGE